MKTTNINEIDNVIAPNQAAITRFPSPIAANPPQMSKEEKIDFIASRFQDILEVMGLDLSDDSLAKTPYRIAKMYINEVFSGLDYDAFPAISFIKNKFQGDHKAGMVLVKTNFHSFCEHHFVPMSGTAYIAYVPNEKVIGLSKIPRIVHYFASRPQVQERLTVQIADCLALLLETENVAVSMTAKHFCVMARGIQDEDSNTTTNVLRGHFDADDNLRKEFFEGINRRSAS